MSADDRDPHDTCTPCWEQEHERCYGTPDSPCACGWCRESKALQSLDIDEGERIVGRVLVARVVDEGGGMRDEVRTDDGDGNELDLPTAVGMLAVAQHTLLCDGGEA